MQWVPPALSSQRHRIQGFSLSYSPSEKTFLREEEPVDLTSRDHFLLPRRLNESKGIVAYHQSSVSSNSSSPYMKGCQTVEKLIQLATSQGDLSPTQLAAFWSWMPRLLNMMHNQDHCNVSKQGKMISRSRAFWLKQSRRLTGLVRRLSLERLLEWQKLSAIIVTVTASAGQGNTRHCSKNYSLIAARHRKSYSSCSHRMPSRSSPSLMLDPSPDLLTHMPLSDSFL